MDWKQNAPLNPKLVNNLLEFKYYSNLHKILLEVVSFTLVPEQIKDLREEFELLIELIRKGGSEAKPLPWGCRDTKLPPQPTVPLIERLRKTEISSGKYSIESHSFIRLST